MPQHTDLGPDLQLVETTLRKLETEYNMYFAGQSPRPPLGTRRRLEQLLGRLDRGYVTSSVDRFRLGTLQSRYATLAELWDRALRAREEGRPGPFSKPARAADPVGAPPLPAAATASAERVFGAAMLTTAQAEGDELRELYESLLEARKAVGAADPFPFSRFSDIVKGQVAKFQQSGSDTVAFRVSTRDGRVVFTAQGRKTTDGNQSD